MQSTMGLIPVESPLSLYILGSIGRLNKVFRKPWIIERLSRKLADVIGSNIVENCDVTLSRAIQPLKSDVLRVLFFLAYFTISVLDYTDFPCFDIKDEEDLLLEKTVRGYKPAEVKDRVNGYETCESEK